MKDFLNLKIDPVFSRKIVKQFQNNILFNSFSRSLLISEDLVGMRVKLYNGKDFILFSITPDMIGFRLGEFVLTRAKFEFKKKKKKK